MIHDLLEKQNKRNDNNTWQEGTPTIFVPQFSQAHAPSALST
jgi:hypothetical protein